MKAGAPVETRQIWAHGCEASWFKGYAYVRTEPKGTLIVKHTRGLFEGMEVRYDAADVREEKTTDTK